MLDGEERLRAIVETVSDGIVVLDDRGRVESFNRAAERIFGWADGDAVGRPFDTLVQLPPGSDALAALEGMASKSAARTVSPVEMRGVTCRGSMFPMELAVTHLLVAGRRSYLATIRDVSEKKRLEEHLLHSQKMEGIGRLAGGIAHDFNNLLTVILSYTQLTLAGLAQSDPMYEDVEEIKNAAERAAALTRQLLTFARRQHAAPRVVNMNELTLNMDRLFRRLLGEDVELATLPGEGLRTVEVDPGQMEQVLMNLVVNARDAMPSGGRLSIETRNVDVLPGLNAPPDSPAGPCVEVVVSDSGTGMAAETMSRLFEPFFTTKSTGRGTGLGLATSYGIVKQFGGHIWAESQLGQGSRFRILIPETRRTTDDQDRGKDALAPSHGETVMVVEDNGLVRDVTVRALRRAGYTVIAARTPGEALSLSRNHQGAIDLLVSDVVMPEISGPEVAEQILAERPSTKVLFVTGYSGDLMSHRGLDKQAHEVLLKPFTPNILTGKVREILDR